MLVKHGYYKDLTHKELLDIVYVFFMNIQHMKDWVWNFDESLRTEVIELQKNECFTVCADFINNHKHLVRNERGKRTAEDSNSSIRHQHVAVSVPTFRLSMSVAGQIENEAQTKIDKRFTCGAQYRWDIVHGTDKYDAYQLATHCIEA